MLTENEINQALEMREQRPIDVLSTAFADWQTAVEKSPFGNNHDFLEICYAGIERMTNDERRSTK